jgi:hypothetical protein
MRAAVGREARATCSYTRSISLSFTASICAASASWWLAKLLRNAPDGRLATQAT